MDEITEILERLMDSCHYRTEGAVAKAVGETTANFSNKKKTGTIKDKLLLHGVEKGIRLEWLRTGQGEMLQINEAEKWKGKYFDRTEELIEARNKISELQKQNDKLTAIPAGAEASEASSGKRET